jgi:8-oxo-dGTP pyrophosphatase MutT (NUDIX family)
MQSGVVAFKVNSMLEPKFLLVQKTGSGKWGFPKGKVEPHLGKKKSAITEAWEEAGAQGKILDEVGRYSYIKNKTKRLQKVDLYLMQVDKLSKSYMERDRKRKWFTYDQALKVLQRTQVPFLRIARMQIEDQVGF